MSHSKLLNLEKPKVVYKKAVNLQKRNPLCRVRIEPAILCKFCEEKQRSSMGRKRKWSTVNKLYGHLVYDHPNENFKPYLIKLADDVFHERL